MANGTVASEKRKGGLKTWKRETHQLAQGGGETGHRHIEGPLFLMETKNLPGIGILRKTTRGAIALVQAIEGRGGTQEVVAKNKERVPFISDEVFHQQ